jgi:hypothetical protein
MVKVLLSCGLFLSAALLSSCQRKALPAALPAAPPAAIQAAGPFSLSLSSGGGFTGQYSGFTLASDGNVKQWERRGAGADSTLWETRIPADRVFDFRKRLEQGGALGISLQESGNMTTLVELRLPDTLYQWSWSGADAADAAPEPFRSWYPEVRGFCEKLKSTTLKDQSRPLGK